MPHHQGGPGARGLPGGDGAAGGKVSKTRIDASVANQSSNDGTFI